MNQRVQPSRRSVITAIGAGVVGAAVGPALNPASATAAGSILKPTPERLFINYGTNAETRWESVPHGTYLTDQRRLFVRNHTVTPQIDATTYSLAVHGDGLTQPRDAGSPYRLTLRDLKGIGSTRVTAIHECTGNGRGYFATQQGETVSGTPWRMGAVGAVEWEGVRLRDVLAHLGVRPDAVDVMATGLDPSYVDKGTDYGAVRRPFPIAKAYGDALLAWGLNGDDLLPDHGYPLRLVLPGWVGIASIKWLGSLEVSTKELTSPWNTKWYRMTGGGFPEDSPPLTVLPVRSAWELPETASLAAEPGQLLHGRAWSGAGRVRDVQVSVDDGLTWEPADLLEHGAAWSRFRFRWQGGRTGEHVLLARATDVLGRTQPLVAAYNSAGYFFDAVVRQRVVVS